MSTRGRVSRLKETSGDASGQSLPPDVSFGSYQSSFSSPAPTSRKPSGSSQTLSSAPIATPSPVPRRRSSAKTVTAPDDSGGTPSLGPQRINSFALRDVDESLDRLAEDSGNGAESPAPSPGKDKRTSLLEPATPRAKGKEPRAGGTDKGPTMTLREQEKLIDQVKRENFALKLKVHFLEERLNQLAPDHLEAALKQNISLKIEVQSQRVEIKKHRKAATDAEKAVADLKREMEHTGASSTALNEERARRMEAERLLEERERELRALRRRTGSGAGEGAEIQELRSRNAQLEDELEQVRQALEETTDALERTEPGVVEELEDENLALRREAQAQLDALAQLGEERDDAREELDAMRLAHEQLIRRHESSLQERSASRLQFEDERLEREALEEDVNALRDKLTATNIEMESRENEFRVLEAELRADMDERDAEWRQEMAELGSRVEEMQDALAQREEEIRELRLRNQDLEENTHHLHDQVETAFAHVETERNELLADKENLEADLEAANAEIAAQGKRVYELEEALEVAQAAEAEAKQEREVEVQVVAALKDKLANAKGELRALQSSYADLERQLVSQREREEELARRDEVIADELDELRAAREDLEADKKALEDELVKTEEKWEKEKLERERDAKVWAGRVEDAERVQARAVDELEQDLEHARNELRSMEMALHQREDDLAVVQSALRSLEAARESSTTDKFSLELELDRLKRDLERCEDELARARRELADAEARGREREAVVDKMHSEKRDLETQLAVQRQARLNLSEKLDAAQASLKTAEADTANYKSRLAELETRLSKDQRSFTTTESQYREQITERNTLLLTICKYVDQILGVDKKRSGDGKPFTNFSVFHDRILERLRSLTMLHSEFAKRAKELETKLMGKIQDMNKNLDHRIKGLDKFELSLKTVAEARQAWRKKLVAKEGELDALRSHNDELTIQLRQLRRASSGDGVTANAEIRALSARALNAERRLQNAQNQLAAAEERFSQQSERNASSEMKWEARVKEYETRVRTAEEKVKRERQGAKERLGEAENVIKLLEKQISAEKKRSAQLSEIIDLNKVTLGS